MFVIEDKWHCFEISALELHPRIDIALIQIQNGPSKSPFRCRNTWEGSCQRYRLFGYPSRAVWELPPDDRSRIAARPDLSYSEGYIKRRLTMELLIKGIRGTEFFELSEQAGKGCSGSPVFINSSHDKAWEIIGVYCAERSIEDSDGNKIALCYAVREDAFRDWAPALLNGSSILEESSLVDLTVD
jgi:hypothetical protein